MASKEKSKSALALVSFAAVVTSFIASGRPARYRFDRRGPRKKFPEETLPSFGGLSLAKESVPHGGLSHTKGLEELQLIVSRTLTRAHSKERSRRKKGALLGELREK